MKIREELQSKWEEIVTKGLNDYQSLSREERIWFSLEPLTTGGIFDQYMNSGAEHISEIIEDLVYLGFDDIAELVRRMNMLFPGGKPSADIDVRNEIIEDWTDDQEEEMEAIDDEFWEKSEKLDKALLSFISANF